MLFTSSSNAGVQLSSSIELRRSPHAEALALPNGSKNDRVDKFSNLFGQPVVFNWQVFSSFLAHVAQSVEHFLGKEEVIGSNPIVGSKEEVNL